MPDRSLPIGTTWRDRVLAHPFEVTLSVALFLVGLRIVADTTAAPGSIQEQPTVLVGLFILLSLGGGFVTLLGLLTRWLTSPGLEQAGLYLAAAAWGTYTVGLFNQLETARGTLMIAALLALSVGCVLRAWAVRRIVRARLSALRQAAAHGQ